jgi:hypothetical protein
LFFYSNSGATASFGRKRLRVVVCRALPGGNARPLCEDLAVSLVVDAAARPF